MTDSLSQRLEEAVEAVKAADNASWNNYSYLNARAHALSYALIHGHGPALLALAQRDWRPIGTEPKARSKPGETLSEAGAALWETKAREGSMDMRDYNKRCAEALKACITDALLEDATPYRQALAELVHLDAEYHAILGGPNYAERSKKAWAVAEDLVRNEP